MSRFAFGCIDQCPLFQSRSRVAFGFRDGIETPTPPWKAVRFNLVLEWLLVSGRGMGRHKPIRTTVSISFSSGFWFQVLDCFIDFHPRYLLLFQSRSRVAFGFRHDRRPRRIRSIHGFNLVLEWLLVSGRLVPGDTWSDYIVSISFSSGFWFQACCLDHSSCPLPSLVSISFSSGFWFQVECQWRRFTLVFQFQSRSRVAFGFRTGLRWSAVSVLC